MIPAPAMLSTDVVGLRVPPEDCSSRKWVVGVYDDPNETRSGTYQTVTHVVCPSRYLPGVTRLSGPTAPVCLPAGARHLHHALYALRPDDRFQVELGDVVDFPPCPDEFIFSRLCDWLADGPHNDEPDTLYEATA